MHHLAEDPPETDRQVAIFGEFRADLAIGELRRAGEIVKLQRQPFEALALLLGARGGLVSRDAFRQALWPETVHVDFDRGLTSAIRKVREALGDSGRTPIYIETRPGRGYRLICPVQFGDARAARTRDAAAPQGSRQPESFRRLPDGSRSATWVGIAVGSAVLAAATGLAFALL